MHMQPDIKIHLLQLSLRKNSLILIKTNYVISLTVKIVIQLQILSYLTSIIKNTPLV